VREGASLTAEDALELGVIDLMADDVDSLLAEIDGRQVKVGDSTRPLATRGLAVEVETPDWRNRLLAILTNPNVAYILMLLGVYGLFFELSNPGNVLPGVAGAICLLLALYAFHVLPVNYAGVALMALGLAFIVAEAFVPSFGALGIGGGIAFIIGSLILMDTEVEEFTLSIPLVVVVAVASGVFLMSVVTMGLRQRRQPVVSGIEYMVGGVGEAMDAFDTEGRVRMHGEIWNARTSEPVSGGQRVRIRAVDGLVLEVTPLGTLKEER
jgi:membrane-bound serine protease (ClpP class)